MKIGFCWPRVVKLLLPGIRIGTCWYWKDNK